MGGGSSRVSRVFKKSDAGATRKQEVERLIEKVPVDEVIAFDSAESTASTEEAVRTSPVRSQPEARRISDAPVAKQSNWMSMSDELSVDVASPKSTKRENTMPRTFQKAPLANARGAANASPTKNYDQTMTPQSNQIQTMTPQSARKGAASPKGDQAMNKAWMSDGQKSSPSGGWSVRSAGGSTPESGQRIQKRRSGAGTPNLAKNFNAPRHVSPVRDETPEPWDITGGMESLLDSTSFVQSPINQKSEPGPQQRLVSSQFDCTTNTRQGNSNYGNSDYDSPIASPGNPWGGMQPLPGSVDPYSVPPYSPDRNQASPKVVSLGALRRVVK